MLRFLILTSALVLVLSPASAGTMPAYDTEQVCADLAGASARQELVMRGCLDFEERTRHEIAAAWDKVSADVQVSCERLVESNGGASYWRLKTCIDKGGASGSASGR